MRCYHLNNTYIIGIHAGIQSAHTQHELAIKYLASTPYRNLAADESMNEYGARLDLFHDAKAEYIDWANNHKTLILLNGGMMSHLVEFETFLTENSHAFAWATFREEEAALNGAMTNLGIVLPEHMYRWNRQILKLLDAPGITAALGGEDGIRLIEKDGQGDELSVQLSVDGEDGVKVYIYKSFEIELMQRLDRLKLMGA